MPYVLLMLGLTAGAILAGNLTARRWLRGAVHRPLPTLAATLLAAFAWFGLSWAARAYADTDGTLWQAAEWWAHAGKWFALCGATLCGMGVAVGMESPAARCPRKAVCAAGVLLVVWLTVWRTIPVYAFLTDGVRRDARGLMRQSVPYTCGPVALANLAEHSFGIAGLTEREMARLSYTTCEGTTTRGLVRAATAIGLRAEVCRVVSIGELEALGRPALVSISTVPGAQHAAVYLPVSRNPVVLLDPERGRWATPRENFLRVWYGKTVVFGQTGPYAEGS